MTLLRGWDLEMSCTEKTLHPDYHRYTCLNVGWRCFVGLGSENHWTPTKSLPSMLRMMCGEDQRSIINCCLHLSFSTIDHCRLQWLISFYSKWIRSIWRRDYILRNGTLKFWTDWEALRQWLLLFFILWNGCLPTSAKTLLLMAFWLEWMFLHCGFSLLKNYQKDRYIFFKYRFFLNADFCK